MTMPNIPEIKARYEAASPGPWTPAIVLFLARKVDVEFVTHARTDIPALVEALEEAQGKLKRIETEACTCGVGRPFGCLIHNPHSVIARILKGE